MSLAQYKEDVKYLLKKEWNRRNPEALLKKYELTVSAYWNKRIPSQSTAKEIAMRESGTWPQDPFIRGFMKNFGG
jgi:hypothetical protein